MRALGFLLSIQLLGSLASAEPPIDLPAELVDAETRRVEIARRVARSTVAIFEAAASNGGSGVIVSPDGLVVTNYHVVAPCGPGMTVAMADGRILEAVLLGLDPTGDIALVRLLGEGPFPAATIGDSDRVRVGDEALVVGNPFLLAGDFTPTLTHGIISGVHRYQYPSGTLLEYADCLQTDAAINPGNSGGPLFDGEGRLIGINGRGSFEKRGRVSVGVGYAVSINQVMRFLPALRCGGLVDHATLGASVATGPGPLAVVEAIESTSDAYRRGLRPGDQIVALGERDIASANELLNAVGRSPAGWRERLTFRRGGDQKTIEVRLGSLHAPGELIEAVDELFSSPGGDNNPAGLPSGWRDQHEAREGFANHLANRRESERLSGLLPTAWLGGELIDARSGAAVKIAVDPRGASFAWPKGRFRFDSERDPADQLAPAGAPGLLAGLWVWDRLAHGDNGAADRLVARGRLPWRAGDAPCDVLLVDRGGATIEFFFHPESGRPMGWEVTLDRQSDPIRVHLESSERAVVRVGDRVFVDLRPAAGGDRS